MIKYNPNIINIAYIALLIASCETDLKVSTGAQADCNTFKVQERCEGALGVKDETSGNVMLTPVVYTLPHETGYINLAQKDSQEAPFRFVTFEQPLTISYSDFMASGTSCDEDSLYERDTWPTTNLLTVDGSYIV